LLTAFPPFSPESSFLFPAPVPVSSSSLFPAPRQWTRDPQDGHQLGERRLDILAGDECQRGARRISAFSAGQLGSADAVVPTQGLDNLLQITTLERKVEPTPIAFRALILRSAHPPLIIPEFPLVTSFQEKMY